MSYNYDCHDSQLTIQRNLLRQKVTNKTQEAQLSLRLTCKLILYDVTQRWYCATVTVKCCKRR